jgi:hypothetical protein
MGTISSFAHIQTKKKKERERVIIMINQETGTPSWPLLLFIERNLVGMGWKFVLRRRSWLEGLMICMRNALMKWVLQSTSDWLL